MHYVIIIMVVITIFALQIVMFISTLGKIIRFVSIFPESISFYKRKEDALSEIQNLSDVDLQKRLQQENQKVESFTKVFKVTSSPYTGSYDYIRQDETQEFFDRNRAITFLKGIVKGDISSSHSNKILSTIISAINDYLLRNNTAISDFHLIKEIFNRNCKNK